MTKGQILLLIALFVALTLSVFLWVLDKFLALLPTSAASALEWLLNGLCGGCRVMICAITAGGRALSTLRVAMY